MLDNRNTIFAVILSGLVLIGWQYFYNIPQMEKQRAAQQTHSQMVKPETAPGTGSAASPSSSAPSTAPAANSPALNQSAAAPALVARDVAIAANPRVKIDTPRLTGSISLKGARIGVVRKWAGFNPEVDASLERALMALRAAGAPPGTPDRAGRRPRRPSSRPAAR